MKKAPKALTPFGSSFVWICLYSMPIVSKSQGKIIKPF